MPNEEKRNLWKGCVTSIAQRCKRARNPQRRRRSSKKLKRNDDDDDDQGLPSMALGSEMQYDEQDDSQADSDEEDEEFDMDNLDQSSSSHTPTIVRISSDSEQEEAQNGAGDGIDPGETRHLQQAQNSNGPQESTADSREEPKDAGQDVHVPPGIDPDITVVHLPSTMQTAVNVPSKQSDQKSSPVHQERSSVEASGNTSESSEGTENLGAYTIRIQETYEHDKGSPPEKNVAVAHKYYGDFPPVVGSIYKPGPTASTESVIVSGIKMTPDCKCID